MYLKELSAQQISIKLGMSLKQVYTSLIRQKVPRRLPTEQNRINFQNKPLSYSYHKPVTESQKLLEVAALMLYKGEGAKNGFSVDFVNSDLNALKIFLQYLRKICVVTESRIKLYLYCFSNQNSESLKVYWSNSLGLPLSAFTKPYVRKMTLTGKERMMPNGVLHIRYSDKKLLWHILALIDQIAKKMIK